jgi:hypothetical protein
MKKNVALMIYGQFRNYKKNLRNNIHMLDPFLNINHTNVHVFLLTDKRTEGNYSIENENEIICIFKEVGYHIGFVKYIEDCGTSHEEDLVNENFMNNVKHNRGIDNGFGPRLSYRKYFLNKLKNEHAVENNIDFDLNVYCRLFDMNISFNKNPLSIALEVNKIYENPNIMLGSSELFIIGSNKSFDYFFNLSELFKAGKVYHDDIWDNIHFFIFYYNFDSCLALLRHTYCLEIQYMAHMFYSNFKYQHIRVDYNNPNSEYNLHMLYHIRHDPERYGPYNV